MAAREPFSGGSSDGNDDEGTSVEDFENRARDKQNEVEDRGGPRHDRDNDGQTDPGYERPDDDDDDDDGSDDRVLTPESPDEPTETSSARDRDYSDSTSSGENFNVDDDGAGSTNSPPDFSGGGDTRRSNDARDSDVGDDDNGDDSGRGPRTEGGEPSIPRTGDDSKTRSTGPDLRNPRDLVEVDTSGPRFRTYDLSQGPPPEEETTEDRRFNNLEESPALASQLGIGRDVAVLEDQFLDENPEFQEPGRKDEYSIEFDTASGRLSVELTDEYRKRKRNELTQQVLDETAANSPDDIVIEERDGGFVASFSETFIERERAQTRREFAQQVLDQTPADELSDFRIIEESGQLRAEFTDAFRQDQRTDLRQEVMEKTGADFNDVVIEEVDGKLVAGFSEEFRQSRAEARQASIDNIPGAREGLESEAQQERAQVVESIPGAEDGLEQEFAQQVAQELGVDANRIEVDFNGGDPEVTVNPGDDSGSFDPAVSADVAGLEIEYGTDTSEGFGDSQLRVNGESAEDVLDGWADSYDRFARGAAEANTRYNPALAVPRELYNAVDDDIGGDWLLERPDGTLRSQEFIEGGVEATLQLGNLPATVRGLDEAGETIGYGLSETVSGRGGEFSGRVGSTAYAAANDGVEAFSENPSRATGMFVGTLATSAVGLGAANQLSGRAGRIARYAVQPGEELISDGATFALRSRRLNNLPKVNGAGNRFVDRFPNGRIDGEEIGLKIAGEATSRLSRSIRRFKYDVAGEFGMRQGRTVQTFLRDSRGQAQIPRGRVEMESETVQRPDDRYTAPPDLLDDSLTQAQDQLRSTAQADLEVRRGQVESDPGGSSLPEDGGVQDRLTFDREQRDQLRQEFRDEVDRRRRGDPTRRSSRTAPSVEVETDARSSVEWTRLRELDEVDARRARSSSFETEAETFAERTRDLFRAGRPEVTTRGLLEQAEASSVDVGSAGRTGFSELDRVFERPEVSTEFRTEIGTDIGTEYDTEFGTEFETEFETELERSQEFETEFEQEPVAISEYELEREYELESEFELELEREVERESEAFLPPGPNSDVFGSFGGFSDAEKTWRTSIADADKLLNDRLGGR